tara:strand:+ start:3088 stop:3396 length:309 start_codon:yes stop_codon:yes gene_type:complete
MKVKKYPISLSPEDLVDVTIIYQKKKIIKFALNYRAKINGSWHEIYRVDNYHGFLHEQKFWRSKKPIPLQESLPMDKIVDKYADIIDKNYKKLRHYFESNLK